MLTLILILVLTKVIEILILTPILTLILIQINLLSHYRYQVNSICQEHLHGLTKRERTDNEFHLLIANNYEWSKWTYQLLVLF